VDKAVRKRPVDQQELDGFRVLIEGLIKIIAAWRVGSSVWRRQARKKP
jgi:hypothetical protein